MDECAWTYWNVQTVNKLESKQQIIEMENAMEIKLN